MTDTYEIKAATVENVPLILSFIKRLGAKAMDEWTVFRATDQALDDLASTWNKNNS